MPTSVEIGEFVTVYNIPVLETGIDYPASTGNVSLTREMIAEVIESQDDPHIKAPRIKIGHSDNPIDADLQELFNEANLDRDESVPSLGTWQNLRTDNDGHTLVADAYGVPSWLAEILETAYPARSIEGGAWKNPANNKKYSFTIEAVALLGVVGPGCTSLKDMQELFSVNGPEVMVIEMSKPKMTSGGTRLPVIAQVNVEDIRRSFYEDFATGDRYWWWDRELLADPWEMIVNDPDEGQLYRVPFTPGEDEHGDLSVEWGDPDPIKIQYVPDEGAKSKEEVKASRLISSQLERHGICLAVNTTPPRESERKTKEARPKMAIAIPALRDRLGVDATVLPDDATEEQINAVLAGETPSVSDPAQPVTKVDAEGEPTPAAAPSGVPVAAASGVTVDQETWEQTQRDAQMGRKAREEQVAARRAGKVAAAVQDGKIPPSRKDHYLSLMEQDEQGTTEFLDKLTKGAVVPVGELGTSEEPETNGKVRASGTGWFDRDLGREE